MASAGNDNANGDEPGEGRDQAPAKVTPGAASDVVLSRRRFLVGSGALVAAGAIAGGASILLTSGQRPPVLPVEVPGVVPTPAAATQEPIESSPPSGPNRSARENERHGSTSWELPLRSKGDIEGWVEDVSLAPGDPLAIHLASSLPEATVTVYRLGWYQGRGARVVDRFRNVRVGAQPRETTDAQTGMIRADWSPAVASNVPESWVSGLFLAVLSPTGGAPQYCSFLVRETSPTTPILFVSSTTTHQAYNGWGGKSLYPDESTGATTVSGGANAVVASFDRPYRDERGGGLVLRWEYPFVRFMESQGHDVAYAADVDLERHPELFVGRRLIVFAGHPEYWSVAMRATLEKAIGAGTNVAFFSANEMYWRVRFEELAGGRFRTVTCYRYANIDPMASVDPSQVTTRWRDQPAPDAESKVVGQMYGHMVLTPGDFTCSAADHWVYEGTGMRAGDSIRNLVGQEYDRFFPDPALAPPGTRILASSPVKPNLGHLTSIYGGAVPGEPYPPVHNATIYQAPSGATIFSAGTIQWSWALDDWGSPDFEGIHTPVDDRARRITENVLRRLSA